MTDYLDQNGVSRLWTDIKNYLSLSFAPVNSVITIGRSAAMTLTQTLATVPLALTVASVGSGLVRTGNTVVIQTGVTCVMVNAQILIASGLTALDTLEFVILKNAVQVGYLGAKATTTTWQPLIFSPILVPVVAGDVISIQVRNTTGARGVLHTTASSIYLTVEVVK